MWGADVKQRKNTKAYTNIYNCILSSESDSVMFLTERLDAPRDENLLYHVYQEESPDIFKIFKQLKYLGVFCLSVMLQILADRVTIHKKLYRGRPKVHAATLP